jgi:hypothetical protein
MSTGGAGVCGPPFGPRRGGTPMIRWVGLAVLAAAIPLFFVIRDGPLKVHNVRVRARLGALLFAAGFAGFCLLAFGGIVPAAAFLLLWGVLAWAYNR